MKKFQYSLESVLRFKEQVLDEKKQEYARRQQRVLEKQQEIRDLRAKEQEQSDALDRRKRQGGSIESFRLHITMLELLEREIRLRKEELVELQQEADRVKQQVIDANVDLKKYTKLREKKFQEYQKAAQKENESFIEEFVQNQSSGK